MGDMEINNNEFEENFSVMQNNMPSLMDTGVQNLFDKQINSLEQVNQESGATQQSKLGNELLEKITPTQINKDKK